MIDISINNLYKFLICLLFYQNLFCQNDIKIIQSDKLDQLIINDTTFQKLSGNVIIEYLDFKINCDNILIDDYKEHLKGWGNARIVNDTIECKSDSLIIKQAKKSIYLYDNTLININEMQIYSDNIKYNYNEKKLNYWKGGIVNIENSEIESDKFTYNLEQKISKFKKSVLLKSDDQLIQTDTLIYKDKLIDFTGKTVINRNDMTINCMKGQFKKNDKIELFNQKTTDSNNQEIKSDTLIIDINNNNTSYFKNNVEIMIDPETYIISKYAQQHDQHIDIYNDCYIKLYNSGDSLMIRGDTIKFNNQEENLDIINNVTIQGDEIEGSCKNMQFKSQYKHIHMNTDPVIWINDIQITGNKIELFVNKNNLDSIYIPSKPFIISPYDSLNYYQQIKGNLLYGKLKEQKIEYIKIDGNSKMKYFEKNKSNKLKMGLNNIESGSLKLLFQNNTVKQVVCINQIESNYLELNRDNKTERTNKQLYFEDFKLINRLFIQNKSTESNKVLTD